MLFFAATNDISVIEIEVSEKIDDRYLKKFVLSNLKLNNVSLENCEKLYINYLESAKEYQIFVVNNQFKFFDFEAFYKYYDNIDFIGFELLIYNNFFVIFKDQKFFYYQKINQNLNQDDFIEFLNKKFKIEIKRVKTVCKEEFESFKKEFLNQNQNQKITNKEPLKCVELKINFSFIIYILYLFLLLGSSYYFYDTYLKTEEIKEEYIDEEAIKSRISFNSFEDKFYKISKSIDKNSLVLSSFDYRNSMAKIVISSKNKSNVDSFLESCENILSSSISFMEDSKTFEVTIDVGEL